MSLPAPPLETPRTLPARRPGVRWALRALRWTLTLAVTFAGLLALTFVIGRKVPIDPVLAVLGDRASAARRPRPMRPSASRSGSTSRSRRSS